MSRLIYLILRSCTYMYCDAMSEVERIKADDKSITERRRLHHLQNAAAAETIMQQITIQRADEKLRSNNVKNLHLRKNDPHNL